MVELFALQLQTRQSGEVGDLLARDARHAAILRGECVWCGPILWGATRSPYIGFPTPARHGSHRHRPAAARPTPGSGSRPREPHTGRTVTWLRNPHTGPGYPAA
ncbi:hypothetical protein GCM10010372_59090 [Streptomyces tauricus]|nr:hypothetical protein GCM10010372_59090 [Streptomyces tauricus]